MALCGITHALNVITHISATCEEIVLAQNIALVLCALVSMVAAVAGCWLLPPSFACLSKFETNSGGDLQPLEQYLPVALEMMNESMTVLSPELCVVRCNEASKALFGSPTVLGRRVTDCIHSEDVTDFETAIAQMFDGHSDASVTLEYRVLQSAGRADSPLSLPTGSGTRLKPTRSCSPTPSCLSSRAASSDYLFKIHPTASSGSVVEPANDCSRPEHLDHSKLLLPLHSTSDPASVEPSQYVWVESTMCKGPSLSRESERLRDRRHEHTLY